MAHPAFDNSDFLAAALALAAEHGPSAVTVAAISARLKAPTGSFYHRFASRDALLAQLWFDTVVGFQEGIEAALDAGDGLRAALHTPAWVREHLDEGRLLLLYHRDDFVHGDWPQALRDGLAEQGRRGEARLRKFARETFGRAGPNEIRRAQFVLAEVPVAAVRQYLIRRERPPKIVDELISTTWHAVVDGHRAELRRASNHLQRAK
ncbi:MAG: helix-turn-helix domain-containing protein [Acetobacteraceae bacterium]|jgi:AcrR family transcriptional regulator